MRLDAGNKWRGKLFASLCSDQDICGRPPAEVPAFEEERAAVSFNKQLSGVSHLVEVPNVPPRENLQFTEIWGHKHRTGEEQFSIRSDRGFLQ